MALNFPSNPSDGDVYLDFVFDEDRGVWRANNSVATVISSSTPPTTAKPDQVWFNTNDAVLFINFDDGSSTQWVEMQNPASFVSSATSASLEARITALENRVLPIEQPPIIAGQVGTTGTFAAAQKVPFDDFWVQRGITYNSSTRRFTVPTAGKYRITMNPFTSPSSGGFRLMIGVNNDAPDTVTHRGHCYKAAAEHDTLSLDTIVSLNANDYIVFYLYGGYMYNGSTDRFNQFSIARIGN